VPEPLTRHFPLSGGVVRGECPRRSASTSTARPPM
jgi:hypothetical protein